MRDGEKERESGERESETEMGRKRAVERGR